MGIKERFMIKTINIQIELMGKQISAFAVLTDDGITVSVSGGDRSHIGAVSIADPEGRINTITFPEHKETVIAEKWALEIWQKLHQPVAVSAGIHYDGISKAQIGQVLDATDSILKNLLDSFSIEGVHSE